MGLLDILFPISCLGCGNEGKYLCNPCLSKVGNAKLFCLECHKSSIDGATHAKCKRKRSIDFAYATWDYGGVVRKAILKLKYNFAYKIAEELAQEFVEKVKRDVQILPKNAILIPGSFFLKYSITLSFRYLTITIASVIPAFLASIIICQSIGFPATYSITFGRVFVSCFKRIPSPAAIMTAFII